MERDSKKGEFILEYAGDTADLNKIEVLKKILVRLFSCLHWYNRRLAKYAQNNLPVSHIEIDKTWNEHRVCPRINVKWFVNFVLYFVYYHWPHHSREGGKEFWIFKTTNSLEDTLQKVQQLASYFQKMFLPRWFEKIYLWEVCWMWKN